MLLKRVLWKRSLFNKGNDLVDNDDDIGGKSGSKGSSNKLGFPSMNMTKIHGMVHHSLRYWPIRQTTVTAL